MRGTCLNVITDNAFVSRFKCYSVAVVRFITKWVQARGAKGYRILRRRMRREGEGPGFPCKASILGDGEARPPKLEVERTLHVIWMTRKFLLLLDVHLCICYCDGMLQLPFYPSLKPVYQGYSNGGPRSTIWTAKTLLADRDWLL